MVVEQGQVTRADFHFDEGRRWLEVRGIRYDYGLFAEWGVGGMEVGQLFKLFERGDGVITVQRIEEE